MHRCALPTILVALSLVACGQGAELPTRTFHLKYLSPEEAVRLIRAQGGGEGARVSYRSNAPGEDSAPGVTVSDTRDNLDKIAMIIDEYDQPPMVQLSFQVIQADGATTRDSAIAEVEAVLRRLFRFRGYRLAAEGVVGGVEGSGLKQVLTGRTGAHYIITARIDDVRGFGDSATVVVQVHLQVAPGSGEIQSVVRLPVGKTAVLGNTQAATAGGTLILTVRPELVSP